MPRRTLTPAEIRAEADRLKADNFDHVLLLTGEDRRAAPPEYVREAVAYCHGRFSSVGIENRLEFLSTGLLPSMIPFAGTSKKIFSGNPLAIDPAG